MSNENMPPFLRSQKAMIKQKIDQIIVNCGRIAVRCQVDNKWESKYLTELPTPLAIQQSLLLLRRVLLEDCIVIYHVDNDVDKEKSLLDITQAVEWAKHDMPIKFTMPLKITVSKDDDDENKEKKNSES